MTEPEFRDLYGLYFDDANKIIYNLPRDVIENTIKAFSVSATAPTGYSAPGAPTGRYLAPANVRKCVQVVTGDCAPQTLYVTGPGFTRFDLTSLAIALQLGLPLALHGWAGKPCRDTFVTSTVTD